MKKIFVLALVIASALSASPAHAYYLIGRVWGSTSTAKSPVAYTGNIPSTYVTKINNALGDWDVLPGSSLNTGTLNYTTSVSTYDNGSFKITRQDVKAIVGSDYPAVTVTFAGANSATVYISTRWTWSNAFDDPNNIGHLRTVLTHEFGHVWGLDHPWANGQPMTATEKASVMNANYSVKYTPNSDDIAGMAAMY
jgi:hypothetical protein